MVFLNNVPNFSSYYYVTSGHPYTLTSLEHCVSAAVLLGGAALGFVDLVFYASTTAE